MDQNNYQDRSVQQPAAEEKTTPRRRRADMYQQQGNAANVTNAETAKPAVEDVSGTTQKMPSDCVGFGAQLTLQTYAPYETTTGQHGEILFDALSLQRE